MFAVFSKCFAAGVALLRVSVETDVPCNLGGLRTSFAPLSFRKVLTFHLLGLTITVYIEHFLLEELSVCAH